MEIVVCVSLLVVYERLYSVVGNLMSRKGSSSSLMVTVNWRAGWKLQT